MCRNAPFIWLIYTPSIPMMCVSFADQADKPLMLVHQNHCIMPSTKKLTTCLWFNGRVEEALDFYASVFDDFSKGSVAYYGEGGPMPKGTLLVANFRIRGQEIMLLNGGPAFSPTEAFSFVIHCSDQQELDYYWEKLGDGGREDACGWLKDRFGISWQIVPAMLQDLIGAQDPAKAQRVFQALMQMKKLDIQALQAAYDGN